MKNPTTYVIEPYLLAEIKASGDTPPETLRRLTAAELSNAEAAISNCTRAAERARKSGEESGLSTKEIRYRAVMAYKLAMPRMDTTDGCIEAIACAVNGLMADMLSGQDVSKLLYAAQVAQSLLRGPRC